MKKINFIILLITSLFLLSSCDYPEKSFQALSRDEIPTEVTRDFKLERGVYAPFIWTSNNSSLIIDGTNVKVIQKTEDVVVEVKATINKRSEIFEILVLKIGSELSSKEQAEDVLVYLNGLEININSEVKELPSKIGNIYIKYYPETYNLISSYSYYIEENKLFITNNFFRPNGRNIILASFYYDDPTLNYENYVHSGNVQLIIDRVDSSDEYYSVITDLNVGEVSYNIHNGDFRIDNLTKGDILDFTNEKGINVSFELSDYDFLEKLSDGKYLVIANIAEDGIFDFTATSGTISVEKNKITKITKVNLFVTK